MLTSFLDVLFVAVDLLEAKLAQLANETVIFQANEPNGQDYLLEELWIVDAERFPMHLPANYSLKSLHTGVPLCKLLNIREHLKHAGRET